MIQTILICAGILLLLGGLAWLLAKRHNGLNKSQASNILKSHEEERKERNQAEAEAQQRLQQNKQEAEKDLQRINAEERKALEEADTAEGKTITYEANQALARWSEYRNKKLQSAWWIGLVLVLSWLCVPQVQAAISPEQKLIKQLTKALIQCQAEVDRCPVMRRKTRKDCEANCERRVKQEQARSRQLEKELVERQKEPPGNTGLKIALGVSISVAIIGVGTAVVFGIMLSQRSAAL